MKEKVIIIGGATASGKSELAINLAKRIEGEIVSCDSMQVYKEMNIGTAKPTVKEMQEVKHHMIDVVNPDEEFNVYEYVKIVKQLISDIVKRKKVPIIVGGTGLYVESLIYNIEFSNESIDKEYRKELENISKIEGNEVLFNMLKEIDIETYERLHINDTKRIIRALEVYHQTGKTLSYFNKLSRKKESEYDYYIFGITMPREELYQRIEKRVDKMLEEGLVDEVKMLKEKYTKFPTSMQGLGYKEVLIFLNNECTYEQMVQDLKKNTRHYAKRQITWFKKYDNMIWFDKNELDLNDMIKEIEKNYN